KNRSKGHFCALGPLFPLSCDEPAYLRSKAKKTPLQRISNLESIKHYLFPKNRSKGHFCAFRTAFLCPDQ
ncbi:MAG: hypothetical protein NZ519_14135, partial [Bacteroidia bacterium]|nr:hypothetical protein [Bacteroidia bacterium]